MVCKLCLNKAVRRKEVSEGKLINLYGQYIGVCYIIFITWLHFEFSHIKI